MSVHFFAYGSLVFPEILHAVTGRRLKGRPAVLPGYARYLVRGASYPGIVPADRSEARAGHGRHVDGVVYAGLSGPDLRVLDRFEGAPYRRTTVHVRLDREDRVLSAQTYVFIAGSLTKQLWDAERFRRHHLRSFLRRYRGFDRIDRSCASRQERFPRPTSTGNRLP